MPFNLSAVKPYEVKVPPVLNNTATSTTGFNLQNVKPYVPQQQDEGQVNNATPPVGLENTKDLSFVAGFANSVNQLTTGILKAITPGGGVIDKQLNQSRDFVRTASDISRLANPGYNTAGQIAGSVATYIPAVKAAGALEGAGLVAKAATSTPVVNALYGAANNPESMTRTEGAILGGAIGAGASVVGAGVNAVGKLLPKGQIAKYFSQGDLHPEIRQAGARLGVEISPFESTSSVNAKQALEANVKMNPDMMKELSDRVIARDDQLKHSFDKIVQSVALNPAEKGLTGEIYASLKPRQIAPENLSSIVPQADTAPNFTQRLYAEAHSPSSGLNFDNVKPGSFEDIQLTRDFINGKIQGLDNALGTAKTAGKSAGSKGPQGIALKEAKGHLTDALMSVSSKSELPYAEGLIKREGFVNNINQKIAAIKTDGPITAQQIYDKVLPTTAKQEAFVKNVERHGGKAEQAADFINVMQALKHSPVEKLLNQNAQKGLGISNLDLGKLGAIGYAAGPVGAAASLLGGLGLKSLKSKAYYNQIFKELPQSEGSLLGGSPAQPNSGNWIAKENAPSQPRNVEQAYADEEAL